MKKVVNAIITQGEKFLVIKRAGGLHAGKWAFPGGVVEEGESDKQALKREILEETGLEIKKIVRKISSYSYPRENNEETFGRSFLVVPKSYNVKKNEEVREYKWVSIEEFEDLDHIRGLDEEALESLYPRNKKP